MWGHLEGFIDMGHVGVVLVGGVHRCGADGCVPQTCGPHWCGPVSPTHMSPIPTNPTTKVTTSLILGGRSVRCTHAVRKKSLVSNTSNPRPKVLNSAPYSPCWYTSDFFC